ncbi:MAG: hypothetical protein LPK45_12200 [Bacteroidota bacterium]|nr:hypothetical protein [Bacteroidota bacterium]MDX5431871.1 hypothetical protein [Bacteroidota bacterium]MDX5470585.1 hypothetical protein [Bacteroidota bacterium]
MKSKLYLPLLFMFFSCGSGNEYWDVSHFKLQPEALSDKEEIKVIFATQSPDNNQELEYYVHFVGVYQKTGDRVNLLSAMNNLVEKSDANTVFNYFSPESVTFKMTLAQSRGIPFDNVKELDDLELEPFEKVLRIPKFDFIANNQYPTVFGSLGHIYEKGEDWKQDLPEAVQGSDEAMDLIEDAVTKQD